MKQLAQDPPPLIHWKSGLDTNHYEYLMDIDEANNEENFCVRRHCVTFLLSKRLVMFYQHSYTLHNQFMLKLKKKKKSRGPETELPRSFHQSASWTASWTFRNFPVVARSVISSERKLYLRIPVRNNCNVTWKRISEDNKINREMIKKKKKSRLFASYSFCLHSQGISLSSAAFVSHLDAEPE